VWAFTKGETIAHVRSKVCVQRRARLFSLQWVDVHDYDTKSVSVFKTKSLRRWGATFSWMHRGAGVRVIWGGGDVPGEFDVRRRVRGVARFKTIKGA